MPSHTLFYPINFLRNIGRRGAASRLHIVADIENIFSPRFARLVRNETRCLLDADERFVLVYRRFELRVDVARPADAAALARLIRARKCDFQFTSSSISISSLEPTIFTPISTRYAIL